METFTAPQSEEEVLPPVEEIRSVESHVEQILKEVNVDTLEIIRLSHAVGERPGFGFEGDLNEAIDAIVARFKNEFEKMKIEDPADAAQRELDI